MGVFLPHNVALSSLFQGTAFSLFPLFAQNRKKAKFKFAREEIETVTKLFRYERINFQARQEGKQKDLKRDLQYGENLFA